MFGMDASTADNAWLIQASVLLIPAAVMTIGENLTCSVSRAIQAASQNLSAGIIMGALSSEIQPMIMDIVLDERHSSSLLNRCVAILAVVCGSMLAMWTNFFVASLVEDDDDDEGGGGGGACPCLTGGGESESESESGDGSKGGGAPTERSEIEMVSGGGYQSVGDGSGAKLEQQQQQPQQPKVRKQRRFPSISKSMNNLVVQELMGKVRERATALEVNGGEDRSAFDDVSWWSKRNRKLNEELPYLNGSSQLVRLSITDDHSFGLRRPID